MALKNQELHARIVAFYQRHCERNVQDLIMRQYEGEPVIEVSLTRLVVYNQDLADDLKQKPDKIIPYFERAIEHFEDLVDYAIDHDDIDVSFPTGQADPKMPLLPANTQLEFTDPTADFYHGIGEARKGAIGKLVAMEGLCRQVSDNKPRVIETQFECQRCGTDNGPFDVSGTFDLDDAKPYDCVGCEREGPFKRNPDKEKYEEYQQLKIQESPGDAVNESAPREMVANCLGVNLIDRIEPGDRATVVGIVREAEDNDSTLLDTRLEVLSIIPEQVQFEEVEFSDNDVDHIKQIANSDNVFERIRDTIAPSIYGYDKIKLGIALQQFGGTTRFSHGNRKRGEMHIMLIGDPGVGKSQLLQSSRSLAPRAISAGGTGSTSVGLTASAQKEKIGDEEQWTLQAGSLVLADGGLITIDELDNLKWTDQQSLDEALSEGQLNVDKAKIHATLKTRCSALMAANPEKGRFDPYEPIAEQFDMPEELLDRCDLVFAMRDQPDPEIDSMIADSVMSVHERDRASADGGAPVGSEELIGDDIFRKYVAYARRNFNPVLTEESKTRLKDWYLNIRDLSIEGQISINTRFFEGALRASQASARARLSEEVEESDVNRAIDLIMHMMNDLGLDPEGEGYDVDMIGQGKPSPSQQKRIDLIKQIIDELAMEYDDGAPLNEVRTTAEDHDLSTEKVDDEIEKLRRKGDVYEPEKGYLRTT